ncbi:hypothetical protein LX77_02109 [Gelidibacter algens]|uniref:Glutamate dehydrogenase n=2 Tax=Gelidibacter algens TaxID=49280 RepID=A0A1A7R610_9FLAO|nr:glutamate dehydrogenase [Gelidibacter algens]RAJ22951.1 hypothetical protein LX77_02109 [Gelidibacter algens]
MTLILKQLLFISVLFLGISTSFAQFNFSNELGVIFGPVALQSDFGERRDFETNAGNTGIGIGFVHFMNFEYTRGYSQYSYFKDHFRVRSELSWNKTKLNHFGEWVDPSKTSANADKLRAHSGESNNLDIGMQLEYFPFSMREFSYEINTLAPFVSLGAHLTSYNPKVSTTYDDGNPTNLNNYFDPWHLNSNGSVKDTDFIKFQSGAVFSIVGSIGTRYKLTALSDLMLDLRLQYYFNDSIDGLDHKLASNQSNDYLIWLNFGYIFYFE